MGSTYLQLVHQNVSVELLPPPEDLFPAFVSLFTPEATKFLAELILTFDQQVEQLHINRRARKLALDQKPFVLSSFTERRRAIKREDWVIDPIPKRLQNRHLDLGDVAPCLQSNFIAALNTDAQGIQADFDDGNCPNWRNQIAGHYNIYQAVRNQLEGAKPIHQAPVLMLRPRAWNMTEINCLINGKPVPGPLFDFGLLMWHNAYILVDNESGPFFYLSKLESASEAELWDEIFVWTQQKLNIPFGTIKACVLIENVLAAFEMEEILYNLRSHCIGLNCGIWDYCASFISKFGHRKDFALPDRNKYVSVDSHFLKSYMTLLIQVCHRHRAYATGGMAALTLPGTSGDEYKKVLDKVLSGKLKEIQAGVDGFMVFDLQLIPYIHELWVKNAPGDNQLHISHRDVTITAKDLLSIGMGGVTASGLEHNVAVGILFIDAWFRGYGTFLYRGAVEDSATAEISRSQVWQWVRHQVRLEELGLLITRNVVIAIARNVLIRESSGRNASAKRTLYRAAKVFLDLVSAKEFPEFITTYLITHTNRYEPWLMEGIEENSNQAKL